MVFSYSFLQIPPRFLWLVPLPRPVPAFAWPYYQVCFMTPRSRLFYAPPFPLSALNSSIAFPDLHDSFSRSLYLNFLFIQMIYQPNFFFFPFFFLSLDRKPNLLASPPFFRRPPSFTPFSILLFFQGPCCFFDSESSHLPPDLFSCHPLLATKFLSTLPPPNRSILMGCFFCWVNSYLFPASFPCGAIGFYGRQPHRLTRLRPPGSSSLWSSSWGKLPRYIFF